MSEMSMDTHDRAYLREFHFPIYFGRKVVEPLIYESFRKNAIIGHTPQSLPNGFGGEQTRILWGGNGATQ
jgi:hypothetical protein